MTKLIRYMILVRIGGITNEVIAKIFYVLCYLDPQEFLLKVSLRMNAVHI